MTKPSDLINKVAEKLRPEVFMWTEYNHVNSLAGGSWSSIQAEQYRTKRIVRDVLTALEKAGGRIADPVDIENAAKLPIGALEIMFNKLDESGQYQKKYFVRLKK